MIEGFFANTSNTAQQMELDSIYGRGDDDRKGIYFEIISRSYFWEEPISFFHDGLLTTGRQVLLPYSAE